MNEFKTPMFQAMQLAQRTKEMAQTIDSREIAGMLDKNHAHVLRDIAKYEDVISTNPELDSLNFFIPGTYEDGKGESRKNYLVTKRGCEMIANKLTGTKGIMFTAVYVEKFNRMEQAVQVTPEQSLAMLFRSQADLLEDTEVIKEDVKMLKGEMRLSSRDERKLDSSINKRVVEALGGKKSQAYRDASLRQTVFAQFWKEYKNYFGIVLKGDLPRIKLQEANVFIREWTPSTENRMAIHQLNDQIELNLD